MMPLLTCVILPVVCLLGCVLVGLFCASRSRRGELAYRQLYAAATFGGGKLILCDALTGEAVGVLDPFDEYHTPAVLRSAAASMVSAAQDKDEEADYGYGLSAGQTGDGSEVEIEERGIVDRDKDKQTG